MSLVGLEDQRIKKGFFVRQFANYFVPTHPAETPFRFNLSLMDWITHISNALEEALLNI